MSPTVRDVAKAAGVSIATVSRVINNFNYVSLETREKVMGAVERLQFIPNPKAQEISRLERRRRTLAQKTRDANPHGLAAPLAAAGKDVPRP